MSAINILNVVPMEAAAAAASPLNFEVTFECVVPLQADVEWKMVFVADPDDPAKDQTLECIDLGPLQVAPMKFVFTGQAPNLFLVSKDNQLDVLAILLVASYRGNEFARIGYYVKHDYIEGSLPIDPATMTPIIPENLDLSRLVRRIDAEHPRITKFIINWDSENPELAPPPAACEEMDDEEEEFGIENGQNINQPKAATTPFVWQQPV